MKAIEWKGDGPWTLFTRDNQVLRLSPGTNKIEDSDWKKVHDHPRVKKAIADKRIVVK